MTYGYGPPPGGQPSGDDSDPPVSRGRRRAQPPPDATSAWYPQAEPSDPSSRRFPSPPPPARHLGRPSNSGSQPVGYPAFPPPVPTSPTVPRPTSPRPAGPRPDATGMWGGPRPGGPGVPAGPRPGPRPGPQGGFGGPAGPGTLPRPAKPGPKQRPPRRPRRSLPPLPTGPAVPKSVLIRNAVPGLIRHLPHHKPWMIALSVIAVAVVVSTCGLGSFLLFKDDRQLTAQPPPTQTIPKRDISSRDKDKALMAPADVFPNKEITADPAVPPYKQIGDVQVNADCRAGASGDLGKLLVAKSCSQIIRATFSSTDGHYLVTAGIFNMLDAASASQVVEQIKGMDPSKGRFTGYITTAETRVIGRSATQVGWESEGHFLIYCVIARADGQDLATDDPMIRVIVYDMVEKYLRDTVILNWSIDRSSASPSAGGASASPPAS